MKNHLTLLVTVFALMLGFAPHADAASSAELKSRMAKRLSQVVSLKQDGTVGENNKGYLSARKGLTAAQTKLMTAENADRKAVYAIIAAKTKTSAVTVGKTRAASIRKSAPKGTWVQLASGAWKKM